MINSKLFKADIALIIAFLALTVWAVHLKPHSTLYYWLAYSTYVGSKLVAISFCPYIKFEGFINQLDEKSKNTGILLSGFSIFKTLLVIMIAIGYVFISFFFLIGEAVLVIAMRYWAKVYET